MRSLVIVSFLLCLTRFGVAQERALLEGVLSDHVTGDPVPAAHVMNLTDSLATISSPEGTFKIPVQLGDSLVFSSIGFHHKALIITEKELATGNIVVKMTRRDYQLSEVEVNPFGSKAQFRNKFMELELNDGTIEIVGVKKPSGAPREIPITEDKKEIRKAKYLLNPASFIYGNFSKNAKARQELHRLEKQKEQHRYNYRKFNEEVVSRTTGYTGVRLLEFMDFCNFSQDQIYRYTDYELTVAILNKQQSFEQLSQPSAGE